jgi:hypothetical protein
VSVQDRCMVYAERTTGSEIVLDAHDRTARWRGSCGISFQSIGSKIILDAPNETPW